MIARICRWRDMLRWDWVLRSDLEGTSKFDRLEPIGSLLRRRNERVDRTKVRFSELLPISIHFDGSISKRSLEGGREYSLPLLRAKPGDVVLSKIDLKNGAVGVVPDGWDNAVVTTHFAVYQAQPKKLLPPFFRLLIQTPLLKEWLGSNKSGADGRKEVKLDDFEDLEVPLPTLTEQRSLVGAYEKALARAGELERAAAAVQESGVREFEAALGLVPPPDLPRRPVQVAWFSDMERWSHEGVLQTLCRERSLSSTGLVALGDFVEVTHGCSASPSPRATGLEVLKISAVTRGVFRASEKKFAFDRPEFRRRFDLRRGDVLMCRTNGTLAYVGMSALVEENMPNLIFPDKTFRVRVHSPLLLPEFLWRLLHLPAMRAQIESCARTAVGNYAIGAADIADLQVMLPPVPTQKRLIKDLVEARQVANAKRERARKLRESAWSDFLAAIFR